ncbi:hypothetical protein [Brevundimonas lenta]|uniref:Lipoprotein n=1 Tax=Brevundimonas lenta TaxID=424796 RepID=A0A7W6JA80_9CAUL|nr:hypothetical protein [Brevundimonas lenta]MBB4081383.1 hypothetical protein [Brevundimonas lenta]
MRAVAVLAVTLAIGACATPAQPAPDGPPMAQNGNDCAVIAAVAKEHYRFNTTDNVPPPLWLDDEGSGWNPRCDWSEYGLSFPATFHPNDRPQPQRVQWVSFKQPRYDGHGATIEAGILHGPLAGMGVECRVISGFAAWTVSECRNTWIS